MKNMNKKLNKILNFGIVPVFIFALSIAPIKVGAESNAYVYPYNNPILRNETSGTVNPEPAISAINPKSSNLGAGTKTITITGEGFIPNSIGRINGSNRPTTFIDNSHLLMQITGSDTYKFVSNGGFFITIWNGGPGGGYSNGLFFTVNNLTSASGGAESAGASNTKNNAQTYSQTNETNNISTNFIDADMSRTPLDTLDTKELASNAIFGGGNYPSGLIQWVSFAIFILIAVILVRKVFGGRQRFFATPLKHD